jgi:formate dehydrogenase iron-sulfur subunit
MHQLLKNIPPLKQRAPGTELNLIDQLLAEQKQLQTPVARFSETHHRKQPDLADHYRSLIPLTKPAADEQYAFEVSIDRCTGCKACVSACHSLNGLDDHETWRDIGVIHAPGFQQTITTACHHCADPACLGGCPVGAYEKDQATGIVRHLDDQCIGCSYCILKCPYDVPKFSKKRGIVRKCDMCHQRLAEGEAPACVQACPTEAIRIIKVSTGNPDFSPALNPILGDQSITQPTTVYLGRPIPSAATAADQQALIPQHAHWPLVLMLTLTQAGIGLLAFAKPSFGLTLTAALIFFTGMAASVLHLGQPLKACRFFLGLRTSWLSREILAFSLFAPIPVVLTALHLTPHFPYKSHFSLITDHSALPLGLMAVFTSVMIYVDTHRTSWRFPLTATRFSGSVASFAALGNLLIDRTPFAALLFAAVVLLKLIPEARLIQLAADPDAPWSPDRHTARLQAGPLGKFTRARFILALLAIPVAFAAPWVALPVLLIAEILERQLFFQSVHAPKMPGNFGR